MKHIIVILVILFQLPLSANTLMVEKKLYTKILDTLFSKKPTIHLYTDSKAKRNLFSQIDRIVLTEKGDADILILGKKNQTTPPDKLIFVYTYRALEEYQDVAVGGLYWKKGRPNLIFKEKNLKKYGIQLPSSMQKYIY